MTTAPTRRGQRLLVVLAGAVAAIVLASGLAFATARATAAGATVPARTISWSATLVSSDGTVLTGRTLDAATVLGGARAVYGSVRNTGTASLLNQTYTITAEGLPLGAVTLQACLGGSWQTSTGRCDGTTVNITSGSAAAIPLGVGASAGLKLTVPAAALTTVHVSVSTVRASVRAATTTNS
ncbi:hypothetical protein [Prauserella cavernicola]|uniref:DUF11 domain-containing protein n=1 Tax=Prauserella cavernicola TaxID=2800127 RepID=A0A934QQZ2_9PSEU|nr:hypothetical protein [Prauserella cavernicola]MBK1784607.1 hypothetical protein [Prauserella cavernicola]